MLNGQEKNVLDTIIVGVFYLRNA